jgi:hypothetical protein
MNNSFAVIPDEPMDQRFDQRYHRKSIWKTSTLSYKSDGLANDDETCAIREVDGKSGKSDCSSSKY